MTEEEEKAIKDCDIIFICLDDAMSENSANDYRKSYKILKNLIEKQSKEIEELKEDKLTIINNFHENWLDKRYVEMMYVNKDKIKAIIEELAKQDRESIMAHNYLVIPVLQSLLEKE